MSEVVLKNRKTGEIVTGEQYTRGQVPNPRGVTVTLGLRGPLARVKTLQGDHQVIQHTDWLIDLPGLGRDIFTDSHVRETYDVADDPEAGKPVNLG